MGQPFRLLVTGSPTWDDVLTIEQALRQSWTGIPRASC
jgi:hypothetical protein